MDGWYSVVILVFLDKLTISFQYRLNYSMSTIQYKYNHYGKITEIKLEKGRRDQVIARMPGESIWGSYKTYDEIFREGTKGG